MFRIRRPSGAFVVACVALFVALSGGAYAATTIVLPHGSVGRPQIKNGAVNVSKLTPWIDRQLADVSTGDVRGLQGPKGDTGPQGPQGPAGANGVSSQGGTTTVVGPQGPQGPSGVNSPLVYTFTGTTGPDSSSCSTGAQNQAWANDTYDTTFVVQPQADGSYVVFKTVKGTFTTIAGAPQPLPTTPNTNCGSETGGKTGTFYGTETFTVPRDAGANPGFNPYASCSACVEHTTAGNSSSEAQNAAFVTAFFPDAAAYSGSDETYDFVYTLDGQTMSEADSGNTGNFTNG